MFYIFTYFILNFPVTPQALGNPKHQLNDIASVDATIDNYKNHPIKEEINILIKCLNPKKATGPDGRSTT